MDKGAAFRASEGTTLFAASPDGEYADGTKLDTLQYVEAKLILKPDRFVSARSFLAFGKLVRRTAQRLGVGFTSGTDRDARPQIREIVFGDTPDFRLYNSAFILRRRISYVNGFPSGDPEIVFKFRHPDLTAAAAIDMRPKIAGKYRIKFKAEVLPLKDRVGGHRILYSHNCQFGLSQTLPGDNTSMTRLARALPPLATLNVTEEDRVRVVNGGIVEEVLMSLGTLDFGKKIVANCDVSLWRTRGEHLPLVGEFAFQVKFDRREDVARRPRDLAARFYMALQHDVADWLALGVTKTAMVYRLKGNAPQSHE
jgi:hypothetical protein